MNSSELPSRLRSISGGVTPLASGAARNAPGGETDVDVEVGRLAVHQEVVEGFEAAELEAAAADRAAGEHQGDARIALADGEVALLDDRYAHVTFPYEAQPLRRRCQMLSLAARVGASV